MQRSGAKLYIPVPDDWYVKESVTVIAPDGTGNVIASGEPLDPTVETDQYARVQGDLLRAEFPGFREHAFGPMAAFGRAGYVRRFEWRPPDGVPVVQTQMYYANHGRGYTATATAPSTNYDRLEPVFLEVLGGLEIR